MFILRFYLQQAPTFALRGKKVTWTRIFQNHANFLLHFLKTRYAMVHLGTIKHYFILKNFLKKYQI